MAWVAIPNDAAADVAEYVGQPVASIGIRIEDRAVADPRLSELIETRVGEPLAMAAVRESILHLYSLGRFEDIRVDATRGAKGLDLTYLLTPVHVVGRIEFRGDVGLSTGTLERLVVDRFGAAPSVGRAAEAAKELEAFYRDRGYLSAAVTPSADVDHRTEQTTLVFDVRAGPRALIGDVEIRGTPRETRAQLLDRLDLEPGKPYDRAHVESRLQDYQDDLRGRGFYEAVARHTVTPSEDRTSLQAIVTVEPGPLVAVRFTGSPIPSARRDELVPIRREGSVDQDLLEDSTQAIVNYFRNLGYWKATATYERHDAPGQLTVTFNVNRGRLYEVQAFNITGNVAIPLSELTPLLSLEAGEPFVESLLDRDVSVILEHYRQRGYAEVKANSAVSEGETATKDLGATGGVVPRIVITEGPRFTVGSMQFVGNHVFDSARLLEGLVSAPGRPFYRPGVVHDREAVLTRYLNRGYQTAKVAVEPRIDRNTGVVDLVFTISEGPQALVDHIIIVGNAKTSASTIENALLLKSGQPLGLADVVESQRRLGALGLFRRVRLTEIAHRDRDRRDVLVSVEEAPANTIGYGGGLEGGKRLRTDANGLAAERLEFATRGFVEVGRRNLWGKNRSVNLSARISIRPQDNVEGPGADGQGLGFNEFRVLGLYREPRAFGWNAEATMTGVLEQAIRSSFNFKRLEAHAAIDRRLRRSYLASLRYSFGRTELFDERFSPEDALLIDRLFPQVRLSKVSSALVHDTRDDPLDPTRGSLVGVDGDLAARALGSQVGFAKTFLQGFVYRRISRVRRTILAAGARLGLAAAFSREVERLGPDGTPVLGPDGEPIVDVLNEIPASERFFAGGDTTVRGFALDRLGDDPTIDPKGFPKGGNALIVLNTEVRVSVWRDVGVVVFLDGGNVFARPSDFAFDKIRGGAGFGIRYRSPIGPIRVDLGFKLSRKLEPDGDKEAPSALHISIGHAF
jgi:outer membrane protein assembly complex protein YaeT